MKKKLPKNWQPSERVYRLLKKRGMPREWVGHQIDGFKLYWIDVGLKMQSWDTVFNRWVSKDWEKVDKRRMYHEKRKVMPAPKPGTIPSAKIKEAIAMTLKKRIEFADYLSRWRSE